MLIIFHIFSHDYDLIWDVHLLGKKVDTFIDFGKIYLWLHTFDTLQHIFNILEYSQMNPQSLKKSGFCQRADLN